MRSKGFTLIELLIVVAIIAILAAIAVPNFLQAQVRAKVSRVLADQRSLATAMEAYFVDYNTYALAWMTAYPDDMGCGVVLSTPVAYITNPQIRDPFGQGVPDAGNAIHRHYQLVTGNSKRDFLEPWPNNCFAIISSGPSKEDNTLIGGVPGYPWTGTTSGESGIYDGTNGTRSSGDIFRCMPLPPIMWVDDVVPLPTKDPFRAD